MSSKFKTGFTNAGTVLNAIRKEPLPAGLLALIVLAAAYQEAGGNWGRALQIVSQPGLGQALSCCVVLGFVVGVADAFKTLLDLKVLQSLATCGLGLSCLYVAWEVMRLAIYAFSLVHIPIVLILAAAIAALFCIAACWFMWVSVFWHLQTPPRVAERNKPEVKLTEKDLPSKDPDAHRYKPYEYGIEVRSSFASRDMLKYVA